jgi:hypothetical protein
VVELHLHQQRAAALPASCIPRTDELKMGEEKLPVTNKSALEYEKDRVSWPSAEHSEMLPIVPSDYDWLAVTFGALAATVSSSF